LKPGLNPVYLILGEEPFGIMEAVDAMRVVARKSGFDERVPPTARAGLAMGPAGG